LGRKVFAALARLDLEAAHMAYSRLDTGSSSERLEDQRRGIEKKGSLQNGDPEEFPVRSRRRNAMSFHMWSSRVSLMVPTWKKEGRRVQLTTARAERLSSHPSSRSRALEVHRPHELTRRSCTDCSEPLSYAKQEVQPETHDHVNGTIIFTFISP
jgi:hypothetical protein